MNQPMPPVASVTGSNSTAGADLREIFSRALSRTPGGAQLVVTRDGETLLDVAGGGIGTDTPVQVFSVSKLIVALAAAHAHEAASVDLDAPLASYWSAFDRPSTATLTARHVLAHASGINAVGRPLSTDELLAGALDEAVAVQEPHWAPGTDHGYHAFTYGALMNGVFRHAVGTSVQEYAAAHIIKPSGADFWFGAPDDILPRLAPLSFDAPILTEATVAAIMEGRMIQDGSFLPILTDAPHFFTDARVQQADWPAMSGISTASSLARIANAALGLGNGEPLISGVALEAMTAERSRGMDRSLFHFSRFGSGVELPHPFMPYLGGRSFGHQGAGGSVIAMDPQTGIVVAYVSTHTSATVGGSDQAITLLAAVREALT